MRWTLCKYLVLLSISLETLQVWVVFNYWSSAYSAKSPNPYSCLPLQLPLPLSIHRTTHSSQNLHSLNCAIVCFPLWNSPSFLPYWLTPNFLSSYNSNIHYSVKLALTHLPFVVIYSFFLQGRYMFVPFSYYPTYDGAFIIEFILPNLGSH